MATWKSSKKTITTEPEPTTETEPPDSLLDTNDGTRTPAHEPTYNRKRRTGSGTDYDDEATVLLY